MHVHALRNGFPGFVLLLFVCFQMTSYVSLVGRNGCGRPGLPSNCRISNEKENYTVGDEIRYFCESKYLLFGTEIRTCHGNNSWYPAVPICRCPTRVTSVIQSSLYDSNQNPLDIIDRKPATCSSTAYTHNEKSWKLFLKGEEYVLAIRVLIPGQSKSKFEENFKIAVISKDKSQTCIPLYRYGPGKDITIFCQNEIRGEVIEITDMGKTKTYFTICEVEIFLDDDVPCNSPDLPNNGYGLKIASFTHERYNFMCANGYALKGFGVAYCTTNGTWYPNTPECIEILPEGGGKTPEILNQNTFQLEIVIPAIIIGTAGVTIVIALLIKRKKRNTKTSTEVTAEKTPEESLYSTIDYNHLPLPKTQGTWKTDCSSESNHIYTELDYEYIQHQFHTDGDGKDKYVQQLNDVYQRSDEKRNIENPELENSPETEFDKNDLNTNFDCANVCEIENSVYIIHVNEDCYTEKVHNVLYDEADNSSQIMVSCDSAESNASQAIVLT